MNFRYSTDNEKGITMSVKYENLHGQLMERKFAGVSRFHTDTEWNEKLSILYVNGDTYSMTRVKEIKIYEY